MEKEQYICVTQNSSINIEESQIVSFDKYEKTSNSFRVYENGYVGIHYQQGKADENYGYKKAEENLSLKRPYPFELESGKRSRDNSEKILSDEELMSVSNKIVKYLKKTYPDIIFSGKIFSLKSTDKQINSKGMDYSSTDGYNCASIMFKHKDSKDISDGDFNIKLRTFSTKKLYKMANLYLENFYKTVEMPKECIVMAQYYSFTEEIKDNLNAEKIKLGTSLFSGKIGQKLFSDDFTFMHDVSDKNTWMNTFWDADGNVNKNDKVVFIKNGKLLRGYADKRVAKKYRVKCTGSAWQNYTDIPNNGWCTGTIKPTKKTAKELLNGKLAIIPVQSSGGGYKEQGVYSMPVQIGLLTDGEKILGRVPPFTINSNIYDMFGKDFIGVAKLNLIFNDKCILIKMGTGPL